MNAKPFRERIAQVVAQQHQKYPTLSPEKLKRSVSQKYTQIKECGIIGPMKRTTFVYQLKIIVHELFDMKERSKVSYF